MSEIGPRRIYDPQPDRIRRRKLLGLLAVGGIGTLFLNAIDRNNKASKIREFREEVKRLDREHSNDVLHNQVVTADPSVKVRRSIDLIDDSNVIGALDKDTVVADAIKVLSVSPKGPNEKEYWLEFPYNDQIGYSYGGYFKQQETIQLKITK